MAQRYTASIKLALAAFAGVFAVQVYWAASEPVGTGEAYLYDRFVRPTMRQVLAWAMDHDLAVALRLMAALGWWWFLRGRLAGEYRLLCQAAGGAEAGSDEWCTAQNWLGLAALWSADPAAALGHFTAVRDAAAGRPPSRALANALSDRAGSCW